MTTFAGWLAGGGAALFIGGILWTVGRIVIDAVRDREYAAAFVVVGGTLLVLGMLAAAIGVTL